MINFVAIATRPRRTGGQGDNVETNSQNVTNLKAGSPAVRWAVCRGATAVAGRGLPVGKGGSHPSTAAASSRERV